MRRRRNLGRRLRNLGRRLRHLRRRLGNFFLLRRTKRTSAISAALFTASIHTDIASTIVVVIISAHQRA